MSGTWIRSGSTVNGRPVRGTEGLAGRDGTDGIDGRDGLPGVNAVPAVEATAAYIREETDAKDAVRETVADDITDPTSDIAVRLKDVVDAALAAGVPPAVVEALQSQPELLEAAAEAVESAAAGLALPTAVEIEGRRTLGLRLEGEDDDVLRMQYGDDSTGWRWTLRYATGEVAFGQRWDGALYLGERGDLVAAGHSMLAGCISALRSRLLGRNVIDLAVGGETSRAIVGRQGGQPLLLTPAAGTLPSTGPVDVTLAYADGAPLDGGDWPLLQGPATRAGWITLRTGQRIAGTLSLHRPTGSGATHAADDVYRFTRTGAGPQVANVRPVPFYVTAAAEARDAILVLWAGRNNPTATDQVLGDVAAAVQHLTDPRRFLVLSDHIRSTDAPEVRTALAAQNAALRQRYGRRFIDTQRYLITYGLADAGIAPTTQDTADIAAGDVPSSLRGDSLHLNATGSGLVADLVKARLAEFGW